MLESVFLEKALLSFLVGGLAVAFALLIGERFGGRITGIVLGLPVVSAIGLFFIGFTQSSGAAVQAVTVMPLTLAMGLVFLMLFIFFFEKFGVSLSVLFGTLLFFAVTGFAVALNLTDIFVNCIIYLVILLAVLFLVKNFNEIKLKKNTSKKQFLIRSVFAGTIVFAAVIIAKLTDPYWGGIIAAFPASYFSTLFISTRDNGIEFTQAIIKGAPLATFGSLLYYLVVYLTYSDFGIYYGTLLGYGVALVYIVIAEKARPMFFS